MRSRAPLRNRLHAAELLVDKLTDYRGCRPVLLAIPRGAVPMARVIADALEGELDVIQVRKIGAPSNPELAVGAIDESGGLFAASHANGCGADAAFLQRAGARELGRMAQRRELWMPGRQPIALSRRTVIVVDDGVATGASMIAALRSIRRHKPARLVCAVAVAPSDALLEIAARADEVVCPLTPQWFGTIRQWYGDFAPVTDKQIVVALRSGDAAVPRAPRRSEARAAPA
jgi:putative phosphoribosyl transferase